MAARLRLSAHEAVPQAAFRCLANWRTVPIRWLPGRRYKYSMAPASCRALISAAWSVMLMVALTRPKAATVRSNLAGARQAVGVHVFERIPLGAKRYPGVVIHAAHKYFRHTARTRSSGTRIPGTVEP